MTADAKGIPAGLCQCGCGLKTSLAKRNNPTRGDVIGAPVKFSVGHYARVKPTAEERFSCLWMPEPNSGCHLWLSTVARNGYGLFAVASRRHAYAHRAAWEMSGRELPTDTLVLHRCDVRSCVNVDHLFLGTHHDNHLDMAKKGRGRTGRYPFGVRPRKSGIGFVAVCPIYDGSGRSRYLGTFGTVEEAHAVALENKNRALGIKKAAH